MEFLHPAMWHDHDTDFARWLHSAMWHVALGTWQWIHQVAAPCNVIRGSGKTCYWIRQVAAPCNVAGGSGMTCHGIRPNVRHNVILHLVWISTISPQSTCHFARVCEILSKSDHPQQKKWRHVYFQDGDLSHRGFLGSNNWFFEKSMYDFL